MSTVAASQTIEDEEPPTIPGDEPGDEGIGVPPEDPTEEPKNRLTRSDEEGDDEVEDLQPKTEPVERVLWSQRRNPDGSPGAIIERTYVQSPLNYFPKIELYGILGRAVKIVLENDVGVDVETLMGMSNPKAVLNQLASRLPGAEDAPEVEVEESREMDALKILSAFAEVVSIAPELLKEAYCVILNVPPAHREWAINHALTNLPDEVGEDILETFIDQSWDAVEGFFTQWLPKAAKRTVQARKRAEEKRRSGGTRSQR